MVEKRNTILSGARLIAHFALSFKVENLVVRKQIKARVAGEGGGGRRGWGGRLTKDVNDSREREKIKHALTPFTYLQPPQHPLAPPQPPKNNISKKNPTNLDRARVRFFLFFFVSSCKGISRQLSRGTVFPAARFACEPCEDLDHPAHNICLHGGMQKILRSNLNNSNTDGSFTMANSNSFLSPYSISSNGSRKQLFRDFFLFIMKLYVVYTH